MNSIDIELYRLNATESLMIQYLRLMPAAQRDMLLDVARRLANSRPPPNNIVTLIPRK